MTTFMAMALRKEINVTRKEKKKLKNLENQLEELKLNENMKKIKYKEEKKRLEIEYEQALERQTRKMSRLLRNLEVLENRVEWMMREGFVERAQQLVEEEVEVMAKEVQRQKEDITEEKKGSNAEKKRETREEDTADINATTDHIREMNQNTMTG